MRYLGLLIVGWMVARTALAGTPPSAFELGESSSATPPQVEVLIWQRDAHDPSTVHFYRTEGASDAHARDHGSRKPVDPHWNMPLIRPTWAVSPYVTVRANLNPQLEQYLAGSVGVLIGEFSVDTANALTGIFGLGAGEAEGFSGEVEVGTHGYQISAGYFRAAGLTMLFIPFVGIDAFELSYYRDWRSGADAALGARYRGSFVVGPVVTEVTVGILKNLERRGFRLQAGVGIGLQGLFGL